MADGKSVFGTITFAGTDTHLRIDHDSRFDLPAADSEDNQHFDVMGELFEDRRKVSLLSCFSSPIPGTSSGPGIETSYFVEVDPSLVTVGGQHLSAKETVISKIYFQVDDAAQLFYDHRLFGILIDAKPYIDQVANANVEYLAKQNETEVKERIPTGDDPIILYYTGASTIFSMETSLGTVSAENSPSRPWVGSPEGVSIKNFIYVTISFPEPLDSKECFWRAIALLRFLELCAGRPQNVLDVRLLTTKGEHDYLEVYWPRRPSRRIEGEIKEKPWAGEILLEPVRRHDEYVSVLAQWLGRYKDWEEARMHFVTCMHDQLVFGPARITAAANMFDLIPASALPTVPKDKRHNPLKDNILHRAKIITDNAPDRFPKFEFVISEAVKCRNRYVHGRQGTIEYRDHFGVLVFLTKTLEFIFAASDLIECGWNFKGWLESRLGGEHPFNWYVHSYNQELIALKKLIDAHKLPDGTANGDSEG
jgi:hypothetical protein